MAVPKPKYLPKTHLKNRNRIQTVIQKYPNGTYEVSILGFGYNPNQIKIQIRI